MKRSDSKAWIRAGVLLAAGAPCVMAAAPPPSASAVAVVDPADADLATLRRQLAEHSKELAEQQARLAEEMHKLEQTRRTIEAMRRQLGLPAEIRPERVAQADQPALRGRGPEAARVDTSLDVATVFSQPSILTPKGTFIFEPSLQYSYSSSDRVSVVGFSVLNAVLIGAIDVRSVNRNNWVATIGGRYGLTNRFEIEGKIPYLYRADDTLSRRIGITSQNEAFSSDGNGLGDIEIAARYQVNVPRGNDPFYIAGLRLKTRTGKDQYEVSYDPAFNLPTELPTGSGFYTLQPSLSAVLPVDPVVFFGGINYAWNIKRDIDQTYPVTLPDGTSSTNTIGEVDPGDSVGVNFGMGLALNERSSMSLSYEHTWIDKTKVQGTVQNEAMSVQLATLQAGFSYRLSKQTNLILSIGAGLTDATPDTTVTLRVPIRF